jgi:predicted small lipoprotein YifL
MRALLYCALACCLLSACGQKGPLVLPDQKKHKPVAIVPAPAPDAPSSAAPDGTH